MYLHVIEIAQWTTDACNQKSYNRRASLVHVFTWNSIDDTKKRMLNSPYISQSDIMCVAGLSVKELPGTPKYQLMDATYECLNKTLLIHIHTEVNVQIILEKMTHSNDVYLLNSISFT